MNSKLIIKVIFMSAALVGIISLMKSLRSGNALHNPTSAVSILLGTESETIRAKVITGGGFPDQNHGSPNDSKKH